MGGSSPILYTIDCKVLFIYLFVCILKYSNSDPFQRKYAEQLIIKKNYLGYLASYLIIKQLKYGRNELEDRDQEEDSEDDEDPINDVLHNNSNSHLNQQQPISPTTFSTLTDHRDSQNMMLGRPISLLLKNEPKYMNGENRRKEEKLTGEKHHQMIV